MVFFALARLHLAHLLARLTPDQNCRFPFTLGDNMSHKTLHRMLTALTLTLAALLTATQAIAAPNTEGKSEAVKPAPKGIPPFCAMPPAQPDEPPTFCPSGSKMAYLQASRTWVCCRKSPYES
jgi:hypothetical protein